MLYRFRRPAAGVALIVALAAGGCLLPPDPLERRHAYLRSHPEIDPISREAILSGQIWEGMDRDEVLASLGEPNTVEHADGGLERWVYAQEPNLRLTFLYFEQELLVRSSE